MVDLILKIIDLGGGCHYYCIKCKVVLNILSNCHQPQYQCLQNLVSHKNLITLYTPSTSVSGFLGPPSLKSFFFSCLLSNVKWSKIHVPHAVLNFCFRFALLLAPPSLKSYFFTRFLWSIKRSKIHVRDVVLNFRFRFALPLVPRSLKSFFFLHASYGASKGPKYMFATSYSISVSGLLYP